ncbi:class I SAM-dependent methyltransferase [bacterium 210820-DFI.6.37]|nr:class I SAM-dependent methyltransferase [bacterium 210820-DFI.6.37]
MNKKIWDLYAPIYERAMRSDHKVYKAMYERIPKMIEEKDVLEIATGPGLLAKHVAHAANKMIATDYSDGMIAEARKGTYPDNLTFQVADATNLPFPDHSFDVVLIANALHVIPEPEKALGEIDRVLKDKGLLIAPNFVNHKGGLISSIWSGVLRIAGVKFEHQWKTEEYKAFLEKNGWEVQRCEEMQARISMAYVECVRGEISNDTQGKTGGYSESSKNL